MQRGRAGKQGRVSLRQYNSQMWPGPAKAWQGWKEGIQEDIERGGTIEGA